MRFSGTGEWLLNDGWSFLKMPLGSTMEEAAASRNWQRVQLPHDWLIWQAGNLYESADAWYRRELELPVDAADCLLLRFDGVYMDCDILLNGEIIASHAYGYTAFDVALKDARKGEKNELMVHIRHQSPSSRWYSGSGIYRDVRLAGMGRNHLVPDSLYTVTEKDGTGWVLRASVETEGGGTVRFRLTDSDGNVRAKAQTEAEAGLAAVRMEIPEGKEWSPECPCLYVLEVSMDEQREMARIGLRTLQFDPKQGFLLNGTKYKIRGVCNHHDLGALGAAFHEKAARRQLQILMGMGVNALRTSHNPPARKLLDICDEMGILVVDEIFDMWERPKTTFDYARFFPEHEANDVASWIRRDRNHPCVIMWSIGNEIYDMFADVRGTEVTRMLTDQVRSHDPEGHAAVTFGSNYMPWEGAQRCAEIVKIPGYNYAEKLYDLHHAQHPDWVIYGSETASVLSSRGIYHFPAEKVILSDSDLQCSSLGNSVSSWGAQNLGRMIVEDLNNSYSMGQFVWSGMDYIGEPTPYHTRSCYFGQVDTAGFPKDAYFLFQSLWTDQPMIHIGIYWNWNPGQLIDIRVMSNCPRTELYLNGMSLGIREIDRHNPERCFAMWQVPFEEGEIEAIGMDEDGRELCRETKRSFGDTAAFRLNAEQDGLLSDGHDLAFVTVQALDRAGTPVEDARDRVSVSVSGGGYLMGLDNGDASDTEEYKGNVRRLFGGKLLIIVGSNGRHEPTTVSISSTAGIRGEMILLPMAAAAEAPFFIQEIQEQEMKPEIPVRRLAILPLSGRNLGPEHREALFAWKAYPENATPFDLTWQITNDMGIPSPCAELRQEGELIRVIACGDGHVRLRALYGNAADHHPEQISQTEISITGIGPIGLDPCDFISAGLYDLHAGDIGAGNEKGITFARDTGKSMVGFSRLDFGRDGSDTVTLSIFTLDDQAYTIRLYDGNPEEDGRLLASLKYQKKSIWNVYQDETYVLPERLTGIHSICFEAERKFHLKGFQFERQKRAFSWQRAGDADILYGDHYRLEKDAVLDIGNNVSLVWEDMDFGETGEAMMTVEGFTPLKENAITVRMENEDGESANEVAVFQGGMKGKQAFPVSLLRGKNRISLVFLPGSQFDLYGFGFTPAEQEQQA